jgi:hypothetical protein
MSQRAPMAQNTALAAAAIVAAPTAVCPGTYQSMDEAPPAVKASAIKTTRIREV